MVALAKAKSPYGGAGTSPYVYRSSDSGATWTQLPIVNDTISALQIVSSSDGTKYAALATLPTALTSYGVNAIFTSSDSGATWTLRESAFPLGLAPSWYQVTMSGDGQKLAAIKETGGMGGCDHIYVSSDSGATATARGPCKVWAAVTFSNDGTAAVAAAETASDGGLYTSSDAGETWVQHNVSFGWCPITVIAVSSDGTKIALPGFTGPYQETNNVYLSADSGVTWTPLPLDINDTYLCTIHIAMSSDGSKMAVTTTGPDSGHDGGYIYTSSDSGATWTQRATKEWWSGIASSSDGGTLVAAAQGSYIYTSSDAGVTWHRPMPLPPLPPSPPPAESPFPAPSGSAAHLSIGSIVGIAFGSVVCILG